MLLLVSTVSALGVTPGRYSIDFEPSVSGVKVIKIVNDEHMNLNLAVYADGDLKEFVIPNQTSVVMTPDMTDYYIEFSYNLPERIQKPGLKETNIIIRDVGQEENGQLVVTAKLAVATQFHVQVPFPGIYAEAELDVVSEDDKPVGFHTRVVNRGAQDLDVKVTYIITDKAGNEIEEIQVAEQNLKPTERKEFVAKWQPTVAAGTYLVESKVDYGPKINLVKEFEVGGSFANPLAISVDNFVLGGIAKFNILVENLAAEDLSDLSAELVFEDANGNRVANERSIETKLKKGQKGELLVYWDTEGLSAGSYKGTLTLKANGKAVTKAVVANIAQDRIEVSFSGLTGFAIANERPANLDKVILIPILLGVIIVLVSVIVLLMRRRKKG